MTTFVVAALLTSAQLISLDAREMDMAGPERVFEMIASFDAPIRRDSFRPQKLTGPTDLPDGADCPLWWRPGRRRPNSGNV